MMLYLLSKYNTINSYVFRVGTSNLLPAWANILMRYTHQPVVY